MATRFLKAQNGGICKDSTGKPIVVEVDSKLPLLVGVQSANNLYDITASDLDGVTEIVDYAFYQKYGLRSIDLPATCTIIRGNAFRECSALTSVNMPNVTSIGGSAFRQSSLSSALIGSACTSIEDYAFYETQGGVITIEATTPPALGGTRAFTSGTKIIVPVGCGEAYKTATNWSSYASYIEEATT